MHRFPSLANTEFVVGNIAPDSGIPNAEQTNYTPCTAISHFSNESWNQPGKRIDPSLFVSKYLTTEKVASYSPETMAFYLGYLSHLITDRIWETDIYFPVVHQYPEEYAHNRQHLHSRMKHDWYDLDRLYLRNHPVFPAFSIYCAATKFENTYMDEFSPDAFRNRQAHIVKFYREADKDLDREYIFLSEQEMDAFVIRAAEAVASDISSYV